MARKPANKDRPVTPDPSSTASSTSTPSAAAAATTQSSTTSTSTPIVDSKSSTSSASLSTNPIDIISTLWDKYLTTTPQRVKLIDVFMAFLVVVGVVQFVYCVIAGNYPFNAFLAGFTATVGQFVLTASLRIQSNPANKSEFSSVSPERAFADFVFGSLILHFFCVNFINWGTTIYFGLLPGDWLWRRGIHRNKHWALSRLLREEN